MLAKRNQGRKQPGSWIGDAIYGVNDGLGAIFGIVSGVSGATAGDSKYVLLAGLSGMIASRSPWAPAPISPPKASAKSTTPRSPASAKPSR
jgi:hypothetical protein